MTNFVIIKIDNNNDKFIVEIPNDISLTIGDRMICTTHKDGVKKYMSGRCVGNNFKIENNVDEVKSLYKSPSDFNIVGINHCTIWGESFV